MRLLCSHCHGFLLSFICDDLLSLNTPLFFLNRIIAPLKTHFMVALLILLLCAIDQSMYVEKKP